MGCRLLTDENGSPVLLLLLLLLLLLVLLLLLLLLVVLLLLVLEVLPRRTLELATMRRLTSMTTISSGSSLGDTASRNGDTLPSLSLDVDDGGVGGNMNLPVKSHSSLESNNSYSSIFSRMSRSEEIERTAAGNPQQCG